MSVHLYYFSTYIRLNVDDLISGFSLGDYFCYYMSSTFWLFQSIRPRGLLLHVYEIKLSHFRSSLKWVLRGRAHLYYFSTYMRSTFWLATRSDKWWKSLLTRLRLTKNSIHSLQNQLLDYTKPSPPQALGLMTLWVKTESTLPHSSLTRTASFPLLHRFLAPDSYFIPNLI